MQIAAGGFATMASLRAHIGRARVGVPTKPGSSGDGLLWTIAAAAELGPLPCPISKSAPTPLLPA